MVTLCGPSMSAGMMPIGTTRSDSSLPSLTLIHVMMSPDSLTTTSRYSGSTGSPGATAPTASNAESSNGFSIPASFLTGSGRACALPRI